MAFASQLEGRKPVAAKLMGRRLVVGRDSAGPFVLHDRCPHRGIPLSLGRSEGDAIVCAYHGWRFDRHGTCLAVPGTSIAGPPATAVPCIERAGLVWASLAATPAPFPRLPATLEDPALDRFWWPLEATQAGLLDAIENHLDPAHPHFVHPWMVRSPRRRNPVDVTVSAGPLGAKAVYTENARATGIIPRLLESVRMTSAGEYFAPTIAEVSFFGAHRLHLSVSVIFGPEDVSSTRPWAHFATTRGLVPAWVKRAVLKALHVPVLRQDRRILRVQDLARAADDPAYAIGPLDLIGPTIWRLANGLVEPVCERKLTIQL